MKFELTILSLSPVFLLIAIKNCNFNNVSCVTGTTTNVMQIIQDNFWLIILLFISVVWLFTSAIILLKFKKYKSYGWKEGFVIKNLSYERNESLNFFVTFILPVLFDDLNCWQNVIVFLLIISLLIILLMKTNLFYANPVLTVLGYEVIKFEFDDPPNDVLAGEIIGICPKSIHSDKTIKFKVIDGNVVCVKQRRFENDS